MFFKVFIVFVIPFSISASNQNCYRDLEFLDWLSQKDIKCHSIKNLSKKIDTLKRGIYGEKKLFLCFAMDAITRALRQKLISPPANLSKKLYFKAGKSWGGALVLAGHVRPDSQATQPIFLKYLKKEALLDSRAAQRWLLKVTQSSEPGFLKWRKEILDFLKSCADEHLSWAELAYGKILLNQPHSKKEALALLRKSCLGEAYFLLSQHDTSHAQILLQKSMDQGYGEAFFARGLIYEKEKRFTQALRCFWRSFHLTHMPQAAFKLSEYYETGKGISQNKSRAQELTAQAKSFLKRGHNGGL